MGGRGAGLGTGSGVPIDVRSQMDVWSYRHNPNNEDFVDAINTGVLRIQDDFPDVMNTVERVNSAELGGADSFSVLGFWDSSEKTLALNQNFTNINAMNRTYDAAVKSGYHPARGDRTGTEAVALHEMGHALTDHVAAKMGLNDLDAAAKRIVDAAYRASPGAGNGKKWAGTISGYAQENNAECIAEAVADYYCNGSKAAAASKAIMEQLRRYR